MRGCKYLCRVWGGLGEPWVGCGLSSRRALGDLGSRGIWCTWGRFVGVLWLWDRACVSLMWEKLEAGFVLWPRSRFLRIVWACTQDLGLFMV